jgi:hypothetical protein
MDFDQTKFLPPHASASGACVDAMETILELKFPAFYQEALLDNPFRGTKCDEDIFWTDPDRVIAQNLLNRKRGYYGVPWPARFLQIGNSGDGGAVFIDLEAADSSVYFVHWEVHETLDDQASLKVADSITEFVVFWQKQRDY